jgi:protein TonB
MSSYTHDSGYFSRRTVVFFAIVGVHGLMIWAFATGLVGKVVLEVTKDVEVSLLNQKEEEIKPPPPPKAEIDNKPPPVQFPPPIVNIQMPVEQAPIKVVTDKPAPPPPPRPVVMQPVKPVEFRSPPDIDSYYPDQARRLEQVGSPIVHWCVTPDGKRDGEPEVKTSSGFDLLDQAALRLIREARYVAARGPDGKPMRACKDLKVTFKLKAGG